MNRPATPPGRTPVALVTGGARRVGAAVLRRLAGDGCDVMVTYRSSEAEARELCDEIKRAHGRKAVACRADFSADEVEAACERVHNAFRQHFGRLDVLVHNASVFEPGDLWTTSLAQLRAFAAAHVEAPLLLTRRLAPLLKKGADPLVVTMTDISADRPHPSYAAYAQSKAALANLTRSLAQELAPEVRVNAVAPGVVAWPEDADEAERRAYLRRVPLDRAGTVEDAAGAVAALRAMPYVTGQTINVDGGRSVKP